MARYLDKLAHGRAERKCRKELLYTVIPAAKGIHGRRKAEMLDRMAGVLRSIPDFGDYQSVVYAKTHILPGPRTARDPSGAPLPKDWPDRARRTSMFLRELSRREYVRTGSTDFLEAYFNMDAILMLHALDVYVPEDLDAVDREAFLSAHDFPEHIHTQLTAFWAKRDKALADGNRSAHAADSARSPIGSRDKAILAASGHLIKALEILIDLQSGSMDGPSAKSKETEANVHIETAQRLLLGNTDRTGPDGSGGKA